MKEYTVKTVQIGRGEAIAYREAGSGPAVLLIHGNMSSSVHWQTVIAALEGTHKVYAPDMRGFGDSTYNAPFDSLGDLALDMEEFAKAVGLGEFTVVGWSAGGGVALELAALLPGCKKVVLINSVPVTGYPMFKKDAQGGPVLTEPLKTKEDVAADPVQVVPVLDALANNNREFMRFVWDNSIFAAVKPPAADYEAYLDATMKQRCLVDTNYALLTFNITGRLAGIKAEIVMIQGGQDVVVPLAWAQKSHEDTPGSRLLIFDNWGHSPITDDPGAFFDVLRREV